MKILITGGSGFIAKNLYNQLNSKYDIHCFDKNRLNMLDKDAVRKLLMGEKYDVIIHAATYDAVPAYKNNDPNNVLEYNLRMFFNLVDCKEYYNKLIYFGSGVEYGRDRWKSNMSETYSDGYIPNDPYGFSKYIMNKYAQSANNIYNLRLFSLFGQYEDIRVRFIPQAIINTVMKRPITLNNYNHYDFLHIDDVVLVVDWFINNSPEQKTFNVCSGICRSFESIIKSIQSIGGDYGIVNKATSEVYYGGSNQSLKGVMKELNFRDFEEALLERYNHFKERIV